ncbi:transposase, partial [Pandoraea terrigena]
MNLPANLDHLSPEQLRTLAAELIAKVGEKDRELHYRQTRIDQLTHEMAMIKRYQFGKRSEQLDSTQASLLDESIDADIAAIEEELAQLSTQPATPA